MFCGTWYVPHSQVHYDQTVYIKILAIWPLNKGYISTSGLKSDVTIVFLNPDFLKDAEILAIYVHLRQI